MRPGASSCSTADRIVFGLDQPAKVETYRIYYRFLETEDEYFNYSIRPTPPQGRWQIYGSGLPDDVLQKVYRANAARSQRGSYRIPEIQAAGTGCSRRTRVA